MKDVNDKFKMVNKNSRNIKFAEMQNPTTQYQQDCFNCFEWLIKKFQIPEEEHGNLKLKTCNSLLFPDNSKITCQKSSVKANSDEQLIWMNITMIFKVHCRHYISWDTIFLYGRFVM